MTAQQRIQLASVAPREGEGAFDRLQAMVADDLAAVNLLIRERMQSQHAALIPELAAHLIEAGGKRLRPILTLAAARLIGDAGRKHILLATTVEFIHTATLLHDDVVDESDLRRGRASANKLWGNKPSVLVGDYLFSRSFQLMVEVGSLRVLDILSGAAAVIAEGEVMQLATANNLGTTEADYFKVIRGKTAALFEAATRVGAIVAGANAAQEAALATYGEALGIAFQLADDVLDYGGAAAAMGKNTGDDFREGKVTLPVILAHAAGNAEERAFWTRTIEQRKQRPDDLNQALDLLRRHGTLAATRDRALAEVARAKAALKLFGDHPLAVALADVADFCVARVR